MQQESSVLAFPHSPWEPLLSGSLASAENYFANTIVLNQNIIRYLNTQK